MRRLIIMTLGQKIKNARKNAGLTQAEFAKLISNDEIKIGNTTVSNWEKTLISLILK